MNSNETVKAAKEKVNDLIEDVSKSETVKEAKEFVKDQANQAGELIDKGVEEVKKSSFWQKLKNLFS